MQERSKGWGAGGGHVQVASLFFYSGWAAQSGRGLVTKDQRWGGQRAYQDLQVASAWLKAGYSFPWPVAMGQDVSGST